MVTPTLPLTPLLHVGEECHADERQSRYDEGKGEQPESLRRLGKIRAGLLGTLNLFDSHTGLKPRDDDSRLSNF